MRHTYDAAVLKHYFITVLTYHFRSMGSSGGSVSDNNSDGRGFAPHIRRQFLDPLSLDGYWSTTENLTTAEKGAGHPTPPCRWPSIMCADLYLSTMLIY